MDLTPDEIRREFRTVVRADVGGGPVSDEQVGERLEHVGCAEPPGHDQREAFPRVLIDDRQDLQRPSIVCAFCHEIVGPDVVAVLGATAEARAVGEPQASPFRLFLRDFQALASPESFHAFMIHSPALAPQERRDASIAVSPILRRQLDQPRDQAGLVVGHTAVVPLRRPRLRQHPTGPSFRDAQVVPDMVHRLASSGRAQNFPDATSFKIKLSSA